jgi:gluconolactonase
MRCAPSLSLLFLVALIPKTEAADLSELVAGDVAQVSGEFSFTEGPVWHADGYLLFSDIPNNRVMRLNADGELSEWLNPSGGANGLVCDAAGNVYACQGEERCVAVFRTGENGTGQLQKVLAAEFEGKPFNKPNDLALDTYGGVYFTDPNYRQEELSQPVEGVYYVSADGEVSRVVNNLPRPNGILVTADGKTLYVANINERKIMRYEITGPGEISGGEVLFTGDEEQDGNGPDGMALDAQGNIYATYKSVVVVAPQGELVGRIEVPEKPANCTFGGADGKTLYITARTSLYQAPMQVSGMRAGTRTVKAQELVLEVPNVWVQEEPSNRLRLAQFVVPPVEGDAEGGEFVVFPPFGGSDKDNIIRWVNQFDAEGREAKMSQGETDQGKYILVDLTGTYQKPVGPPIQRQTVPAPGYRMLGVIFKAEAGGNYFLKLTGPQKTVAAAAAAFRASFGGNADDETEYKTP